MDLPTGTASSDQELHEIVVDLIRRLLLQIVAGRQWLRIDEVLGELAPHGRKLLRRRLPARSPQNEQRRLDLTILIGGVHLEIDPSAGAIVAAGADDRFLGVA